MSSAVIPNFIITGQEALAIGQEPLGLLCTTCNLLHILTTGVYINGTFDASSLFSEKGGKHEDRDM